MFRLTSSWLILGLVALGLGVAGRAAADVHMAEAFLTGGSPAAGEYALGGLVGQGPSVSSFTGTWTETSTPPVSGTFGVVGAGLSWPGLVGTGGGAVQLSAPSGLLGTQSAVRSFDNLNMAAGGDYWLSCMMSFDGSFASSTSSSAFMGVLNAEEGDPSVQWTIGVQWGFRGNETGGVDAVIRHRSQISGTNDHAVQEYVLASNVQPGTHLFVTYVDSDYYKSSDWNTVWFDPVITTGPYLAGRPAFSNSATNWLSPGTDPNRVVDTLVLNATDLGMGAVVGYDQVRFGDSWAEVVNSTWNGTVLVADPGTGYDHAGTYFRQSDPTSSRGDHVVLQVGSVANLQSALRSVLSFSLDDVPEGATVTSALLKLSVSRVDETDGDVSQIELYLADLPPEFDETTASWNRAGVVGETDVPWGFNGPGNPTETLLGTIADPTPETTEVIFESSAAFVAAAQAAVDGDTPLDLAILAPLFEYSGQRRFIEFHSEDASDVYLRPVLAITFEGGSVPGDATGDGKVDAADAAVLARNWLQEVTGGAINGDLNADGWVNDLDASILAANWVYTSGGAAAVPEPTTWAMACAVLALFLLRRRRD